MNSKWISIEENGLPKDGDDYIVAGRYKWHAGEDWEYFVDVAGSHGNYIDNFWDTYNDWYESLMVPPMKSRKGRECSLLYLESQQADFREQIELGQG